MSPFEGIGLVKLNVIKDGKSIAEPTGMTPDNLAAQNPTTRATALPVD